ncbi:MAG: MaoC/PaaZ C-terminal domain-containing protein [Rhodospirillales bacterium]|jgi:3-hydroxybutyryl-CoA dehydratase|nr:MaoC/PaaZ C-terminal domain-containing protein [Rhodospirillales bacterium]
MNTDNSASSRLPEIGETAEFRKTMTVAEQALFTGISGNMHPLYVNEVHAAATEAGGRLAFELAVAALATTALAEVGGPNVRLAAIDLSFPAPTRIGDTVAARVEVIEAGEARLRCAVRCERDGGPVVAEGTADLVRVESR